MQSEGTKPEARAEAKPSWSWSWTKPRNSVETSLVEQGLWYMGVRAKENHTRDRARSKLRGVKMILDPEPQPDPESEPDPESSPCGVVD